MRRLNYGKQELKYTFVTITRLLYTLNLSFKSVPSFITLVYLCGSSRTRTYEAEAIDLQSIIKKHNLIVSTYSHLSKGIRQTYPGSVFTKQQSNHADIQHLISDYNISYVDVYLFLKMKYGTFIAQTY